MISTARHFLFRPGTSPYNFAALRRAAGKSQQKIRVRATKATAKEGGEEADDEWIGGEVKSNVVPRNPSLDSANAPEYMHGVLAFNRFYPENARGCAFNRHLVVALVRCVLDTFFCVSLLGLFPISSSEISSQDKGIKESAKVTEWVVDNIYRPGDLIHLVHISDPDELGG